MPVEVIVPYTVALLLYLARVGGFILAMQLLGSNPESRMLRLVLGVSLTIIFWWVGGMPMVHLDGGVPELITKAVVEVLVGLAAGFIISLVTAALSLAGEILSHDMGFAMSTVMNPVTGRSSPVMSQFFQSIILLLIFTLNLHHEFIRVLAFGFEQLPVGEGFDIDRTFELLTMLIGKAIVYGVRYALPVMGVLVLLTAMLMMLARAVQNINLMEFSFGLRILLGIFASAYFISEGTPFLIEIVETMVNGARTFFLAS